MKMFFALAAAALTATTLSVPASAGTVGCKPGEPMNSSAKATNCRGWGPASSTVRQPVAGTYAYVPSSRMIVEPRAYFTPDLENEEGGTGVSGGAAN